MPRDYARKPARRPARRRTGRGRVIAALLLLLAILAFLIYLAQVDERESEVATQSRPSTQTQKGKTKEKVSEPSDTARGEDQFWFYDLLRKKEVKVPDTPVTKDQTGAPARRYVMQCGSFRDEARAESLKAQLALVGFEARLVATTEKNGEKWYRVVLGPYENRRKAESDRHQLQDNGIPRCQIW